MKLIPQFERLNSGESNSRTVKISLDDEYSLKNIKIGFITPKGKVFITDEISIENGEGEYILPCELLDGKGLLLAQLIVYDDKDFIIKSPVCEFPVFRSVDDSDCPCVTPEGIRSLAFLYEMINKKSDEGHLHNDIYYTESETDVLLSEKAHKSHKHNEDYFTKSEVNERLSEKSPVKHNHNDSYYTKTESDIMADMKSDIDHRHSWYELDNKPGTGGEVLIGSLTADEMIRDSSKRWSQFFDDTFGVTAGETVLVKIRLPGSSRLYKKDCKVYSLSDGMLVISFNNSSLTEESLADDSYTFFPVAINSENPSFILCIAPEGGCEMLAAVDYTGAYLELIRRTYVKIGNEAIDITDEVSKDNELPVTSGAVYDALRSVDGGSVISVNNKTGSVTLTAADVGADSRGSAAAVLDEAKEYSDTMLSEFTAHIPDGIMFRGQLYSSDDLDNVFEDGVYVYSTSSLPGNAPFSNAAIVEVFGASSTTTQKIQRAYRYGASDYSAFRVLYQGTWKPWTVTTDSIAEKGNTGSWNYIKYSSGTVKCWGTQYAYITSVAATDIPGISYVEGYSNLPPFVLPKSESEAVVQLTPCRNYYFGGSAYHDGTRVVYRLYGDTAAIQQAGVSVEGSNKIGWTVTGRWK